MSISNLSINDFMRALKIDPDKPTYDTLLPEDQFPQGSKVALIAPPAAGKTVTVAGMFMRAQAKVRQRIQNDPNGLNPFRVRIQERGSDIHQDISNLQSGIFPAKTQQYLGFRSSPGMLLEEEKFIGRRVLGKVVKKRLWKKILSTPICDLPGETLSQVIWQVRAQTGFQARQTLAMIEHAIKEMRESDAYIFILKASTAMGLGEQIEQEKDKTVSRDPDVNLVRMFEDIANHKLNQGKPMRAVYVVVTAVDKIQQKSSRIGFDLLSTNRNKQEQDMENFVASCYNQFYSALHSYKINKIHYYPMFFETVKNDKGAEKIFEDMIEVRDPQTGQFGLRKVMRPHIVVKDPFDPSASNVWENVRQIHYSRRAFDNLINDLMELAPTL